MRGDSACGKERKRESARDCVTVACFVLCVCVAHAHAHAIFLHPDTVCHTRACTQKIIKVCCDCWCDNVSHIYRRFFIFHASGPGSTCPHSPIHMYNINSNSNRNRNSMMTIGHNPYQVSNVYQSTVGGLSPPMSMPFCWAKSMSMPFCWKFWHKGIRGAIYH